MRLTSQRRLDDGVLERGFTLGEIPGILWTPGSASAPAPLILLGHPGGLHTMYHRLAARARHAAAEGFAAATIELPGSGDRPRLAAAEQALDDEINAYITEIGLLSGGPQILEGLGITP